MKRIKLFAIIIIFCQCKKVVETPIHLHSEISITEIQKGYSQGDFTVFDVVEFYLNRIDSLDDHGPQLNAVIHINPHARAIADSLDHLVEKRGALYGIPVLLKDNMDTGDGMPCTAGSRTMINAKPLKDCWIAQGLRKSGAVILGKTNLSEWANFHSYGSSSGWSGLGGQTKNPYRLNHNPCGSSSGSAVAVSAKLVPIAIGTETNGSIICPANNNGIVGIKPTVGLVSRSGIIPISDHQDTGGPMARSVSEAARVLGALTKVDSLDPMMSQPDRKASSNYMSALKEEGLKGKRIGYYSLPLKEDSTELSVIMNKNLELLKTQGAIIIPVDSILHHRAGWVSFIAMKYEFKYGLNNYLLNHSEFGSPTNLDSIIQLTFADSIEMKFNHQLMVDANKSGKLSDQRYISARDSAYLLARELGMDRVMDANNLDAIVAPSGSPAWLTDHENGDTHGVYSSSPAAIAGYPNITVPMGQIDGLPVGMSIFGRPWSEAKLIEIAYAFEQKRNARIEPTYLQN